jgi:antirestriction protein ArdC
MMCSGIKGIKLGEDHIQQHSAYLSSWMQALKEDKGAIFRAAAAAQRTCDYFDKIVAPLIGPEDHETVVKAATDPVANMGDTADPTVATRRIACGVGPR